MKRLMILSATAMLVVSAANAQTTAALRSDVIAAKNEKKEAKSEKREERKELRKLNGNKVSYQAQQQFLRDFNSATIIKSARSNNFDEFTFSQDGLVTTAYYDSDADLVGTAQTKSFADLPIKAQQSINKMYKGYKPTEVYFFNDNEANETDMVLYNTRFEDVDSYFVELENNNQKIVVQVGMDGSVAYFAKLK